VMASVSPAHDTWPVLRDSGRFAVSLLAGDQVEPGQYFSYPGRRFGRLLSGYLVDTDGWWTIDGAMAWLGCEVVSIVDALNGPDGVAGVAGGGDGDGDGDGVGGRGPIALDHRLVFARVVAVGQGRLREPALVYSSRQGWRVARDKARSAGDSVRDTLLARVAALQQAAGNPDPGGDPRPQGP
jgi:flavin reductase (DIM6/NTAB) family NADH-FMN oxidoreductase RutF